MEDSNTGETWIVMRYMSQEVIVNHDPLICDLLLNVWESSLLEKYKKRQDGVLFYESGIVGSYYTLFYKLAEKFNIINIISVDNGIMINLKIK